jgi:hypothetical protein
MLQSFSIRAKGAMECDSKLPHSTGFASGKKIRRY